MKKYFLIVLLMLAVSKGHSQYTHPTAGIAGEYVGSCVVNNCGPFTYTDDGGAGGNYSNNINSIYRVFCPATAGRCMQITFNSFDVEPSSLLWGVVDYLTVGNGPTQNSPVFTSSPANSSGQIFGTPSVPFSYTSTDASGCLTLRFTSDGSTRRPGWSATLQCVPCAGGPTGTENSDCINATAICSNSPIAALSNGPGLTSEYCNGVSCPAGGENFSNWYQFIPQTSGTLSIQINPTNSADDFDFYIFQASSCGSLGSPIRCSDAGTTGATGATGTSGANNIDVTESVTGNGILGQLTVTAGQRYYLVVDKWSPNGNDGYTINFSGSANLDCVVLGVDMKSFDLEYHPDLDVVDLNWVTENEDNMSHYDVERSKDGENYEKIARIKAVGNTNYQTTYLFEDTEPIPGVNYYRLKLNDFDGKEKYSEVKTVNVLDEDYDILSVFPNPITSLTEVIFNSYSKEDAQLIIKDASGKPLINEFIPVMKGGNKLKLNLNSYENGVYFIEIITKYKNHQAKIMKL